MPPKATLKTEDLIEALLDPRVVAALSSALKPMIAESVDAAIDKRIGQLITSVKEIESRQSKLEQQLTALRKINTEQEVRIDELEAYSKLDNLIIKGLPEKSYAERGADSTSNVCDHPMAINHLTAQSTFLEFCQDKLNLGANITAQDISVAHRVKAGPREKVRPLIVRFTNRRSRDLVYRARKLLQPEQNIYISEQLRKTTSSLFYEARQLKLQKQLSSVWTQGGQVYVKFAGADQTARPTLVRSKLDLIPRK